ncbi:MAG TPA: hypothetical protein VJ946_05245 [Bacteroidales bacterium]|nr:hypothetical protein [Bacteroidales bacterium]
MLKLILIASIFLGLIILGLGIQVFFGKKKQFPNTHIGGNKNMEKMGISCATSDEPGTCSCQVDGIQGSCQNKP